MPTGTSAPQRLRLHPEEFGQAFPESRDSRPGWLPEDSFAAITASAEEFSVLCQQRHIPPSVSQIRGLRLLYLQPGGAQLSEVLLDIDEDLRRDGIPATATFNFRTDLGFLVVSGEDLPVVRSLLFESGHAVEEPEEPEQLEQS